MIIKENSHITVIKYEIGVTFCDYIFDTITKNKLKRFFMAFIRNFKIKNKLILLILLPFLALIFFSAFILVEKYEESKNMELLEEMTFLGVKISAYVHETQK